MGPGTDEIQPAAKDIRSTRNALELTAKASPPSVDRLLSAR
jgi:hypothetical protein